MSAEQRTTREQRAQRVSAAAERARGAWQDLRLRLRGVTPSGLAHAGLILGAIATTGWVVKATWPALLPFVVGGVVAYIVLPIVNRLEAVMSRPLAALATMLAVGLFFAFVVWAIVPTLAQELNRAYLA